MPFHLPIAFSARYALYAICSLAVAGCFGGDGDSSTTGPEIPGDPTRKIVPGLYTGGYDWIDSNRYDLRSELLMDAGGGFEHLLSFGEEAAYIQKGNWAQSGSRFIFTNLSVAASEFGVFSVFDPLENDTNSVRDVSDSAFTRLEWTPLRQKPYWITYKRKKDLPRLAKGAYYRHVLDTLIVAADTSDTTGAADTVKVVDNLYRFEVGGGDSLRFSMSIDARETYQLDARYRQFGSFLVTEQHRDRAKDTTDAFGEWETLGLTIFVKLKDVSDTSFTLWTPAYSPEPNGFLSYSKNGK